VYGAGGKRPNRFEAAGSGKHQVCIAMRGCEVGASQSPAGNRPAEDTSPRFITTRDLRRGSSSLWHAWHPTHPRMWDDGAGVWMGLMECRDGEKPLRCPALQAINYAVQGTGRAEGFTADTVPGFQLEVVHNLGTPSTSSLRVCHGNRSRRDLICLLTHFERRIQAGRTSRWTIHQPLRCRRHRRSGSKGPVPHPPLHTRPP